MALATTDRLRQLLGESISPGEDASETMFSDEEIQDLLDQTSNILTRAAYLGWSIKAANYAALVTVSEGNSLRQMSDLYDHAQKQMKVYAGSSSPANEGRTRVGRIRRRY